MASIQEARERIDAWVRLCPPALHRQRVYFLPEDPGQVPNSLVAWLDKAFPSWREAGHKLESFRVATLQEGQELDLILFNGRRKALQNSADEILLATLQGDLTPNQRCVALSLLAYGRVRFMLWLDHLDLKTLREPWDEIKELTEQALEAREGTDLSEEEFVDISIRTSFVLGCFHQVFRSGEKAASEFLFVIGWYASSIQLGLDQIVQDRYIDMISSLYSILDMGTSPAPEVWAATASILVKDLKVGHYRVKPPFVASRAHSSPSWGLNLQFNESLIGPEWQFAAWKLADTSALLDLVVTDRFIHARLCRRDKTRRMRIDLHQLRNSNEGTRWIVPEGSVLDPSVAPDGKHLTTKTEEFSSQNHNSQFLRWQSYHQAVAVQIGEESSWEYRWAEAHTTPTSEIWRSVYETAFAEAVLFCEQEGLRHLIISPDGSLTAIPHHLLRDPQGRRLGDRFAISYVPNMTGLLNVLDADALEVVRARFVVVKDPSETVSLAEWECRAVALAANEFVRVLEPAEATPTRLRDECRGAGVLHFTGHASFDWSDPNRAFLSLASGERMGLDDLRSLKLHPGALVFLSACHTGRRGPGAGRSSSRGIVSALIEAGAATVICTLWPVESVPAALVSHWFYRAWVTERQGRLESLRRATQSLREASREDCEQILGRPVYKRGVRPFEDEYYWGAFILYGAW